MYNWSHTDPAKLDSPEKKEIWELEQLINFGLNQEKISAKKLKKHFNKLKIDPKRKKFLSLFL